MNDLPLLDLRQADAIEFMLTFQAESIDCIITDPAYESLEKHRAKGTTTRLSKSKASSNEWFPIFPNDRFPAFFRAAYARMRNNTHLYVMCDQETAFAIKPMGEAAGFTFWKPLIWDKGTIGMGYHYRARYEMILFFEKGKRKLKDLGVPDVLNHQRVMTDGAYPTEKPWRLIHQLVVQSTQPGELVVDPFLGSGSTGHAARFAGCGFAGADVQAAAVERARKRLSWVRPGVTT